ncbi:hypothetical protein [Lentzea sp. NPDC059081]|uniref:hypothetical protein n=1 Tax=Lentzea sp. NPDC059081 TaxID=3346719 RepID=UPI0036BF5252
MPEWITSRFMAPVYALLISFGAALVLGALMTSDDAPAEVTVRLVAKQANEKGRFDDVSPAELAGSAVRVRRDGADAELAVGAQGAVTLARAIGPVTLCVTLPAGWTGHGTGTPCWSIPAKSREVSIQVVKGG